MTPTYPSDLPHADLLARVREAGGRQGRMADALRSSQWRDIVEAHPDVVLLDSRDETREPQGRETGGP